MTTYNAAAWLVDRHVEAGDGESHRLPRATASTRLRRAAARGVAGPARACAPLDVRRGERVALVVDDELAFPALFLGALRSGIVPVPLSTMLTGRRAGARSSATRAPAPPWSSQRYAGHVDGAGRWPTPSCATPS